MRIFSSLLLHRHTTVNLVRELGSMMNVPCVSTSSRSRGKERAHYRESFFSRHAPHDRRLGLKIFSPTAEARCSGRPRENTVSREAAESGSLPTHIFTHYLENVLPISHCLGWRKKKFRAEFTRSDFSPYQMNRN